MLRKLLTAKIHGATITECDPDYVGSVTIDADLLRATGIRPNESVFVLDLDNAARFETYVFQGASGSGIIGINGAAAKLVEVDHRVLILCFGYLEENELDNHVATIVVCDAQNHIADRLHKASVVDKPVDSSIS